MNLKNDYQLRKGAETGMEDSEFNGRMLENKLIV
jgi:hypothetical protein